MDRGDATPAFIDAVHEALLHLYDPEELNRSDLLQWLGMGDRAGAPELRRAVLDAINELKPGLEARKEARARRPYRALYHRHVEQFTQREVSIALALSIRQLRREERRALTRLAEILWERYDAGRRSPVAREGAPRSPSPRQEPPSRKEELQWLERSSPTELIDVAAVVDSVLDVAAPLARQLAVSVSWRPPDDPPCALAQRASIRQALINVLTMAIRLAPGGSVGLSMAAQAGRLHLTLRHEAPLDAPRSAPLDSDEHLRMARQLLQLSGGSLRVEPSRDENAGSIILSLQAADRATVLVIDDNTDTLRLVERYLAGSRFAYAGACEPEQALASAERLAPAVILLDVMLPGIDGWELLGRLRAHPKTAGVPIIVCTILPEEHLALSLGAAEFLRKPINRRTLLAVLQRLAAGERTAGD